MAWFKKEHPTSFEQAALPLHGLLFMDGDLLARVLHSDWIKGRKSPMLMFPSNSAFPLWETARPETGAMVSLFDGVELFLHSSRDEAFDFLRDEALEAGDLIVKKSEEQLEIIAQDDQRHLEQIGYSLIKSGENQLKIIGQGFDQHFLLTYDNAKRCLENVQPLLEESLAQPALLDEESRQRLPKLYSGEQLGMEALAQVKFFSPDGGWTWYASEGSDVDEDGFYNTDKAKVDFLFFGLVIGFEIEMGFFSLSELMSVRGVLGLPLERDRDFEPTTLGKLKTKHEQERYRD